MKRITQLKSMSRSAVAGPYLLARKLLWCSRRSSFWPHRAMTRTFWRTVGYRLVSLIVLVGMLLSLPAQGRASVMADTVAPAAVVTLSASPGTSPGSVDLYWIAPGDDEMMGTAAAYVVRYSDEPITESTWPAATDVPGEPVPGPSGSPQQMTVSGLAPDTAYYFVVKAQDEAPNTAPLSNSAWTHAQSQPKRAFLPLVFRSSGDESVVIYDTTEILSPATTQYLTGISGNGTTFTFSRTTPELAALAAGDLMVGDVARAAPNGFLRKVTSVSSSGGQIVVQTAEAALEEAIQSGTVQFSTILTSDDIQSAVLAQGAALAAPQAEVGLGAIAVSLDDVVLYDHDGNTNTENDQVKADGSISLEPSLNLELKFGRKGLIGYGLKNASFVIEVTEAAELAISSQVALGEIEKEKEIARYTYSPITVMAGPVPVVLTPVLTVKVGVDGSVSAGVSVGGAQTATLSAGARYDGSWRPVFNFGNDFSFNPPEISAGLDVKAKAGVDLSLLVYGAVGPKAGVNAYLKLQANVLQSPWWTLKGCLEVLVGIEMRVVSIQVANFDWVLIDTCWPLAQAATNRSPHAPVNLVPPNGATNQSRNVNLGWLGGDPDGDTVTYDVYLAPGDSTPDALKADNLTSNVYDPGTLLANTVYYWRVVAQDEHGATAPGPVWMFTTGTSTNNPPNVPANPSPADGATGQDANADLSWTGGDPDGDVVTYTVYLEEGDSTPTQQLQCSNPTNPTCDPGTLTSGRYYWRIDATDDEGAVTAGPVWHFISGNGPPSWGDDFSGTTVGPQWVSFANGGSMVVQDGLLKLSVGCGTFPFLYSAVDPYPPGDFVVKTRMRYTDGGGGWGSGLQLARYLPQNQGVPTIVFEPSIQTGLPIAAIWANRGDVWVAHLDRPMGQWMAPIAQENPVVVGHAPEAAFHDYEIRYTDSTGIVTILVDGVQKTQSTTHAERPHWLWLGNPVPNSGCIWTDFEVDYIEVNAN